MLVELSGKSTPRTLIGPSFDEVGVSGSGGWLSVRGTIEDLDHKGQQ